MPGAQRRGAFPLGCLILLTDMNLSDYIYIHIMEGPCRHRLHTGLASEQSLQTAKHLRTLYIFDVALFSHEQQGERCGYPVDRVSQL